MRIGIRREDKSPWEARIPLVPEHMERLTREGFEIRVQPSKQRVFSDEEIFATGAQIVEDIDDCPLVIGVKEMPASMFQPDRAYLFFSHTIKAQPYNMPMLATLMAKGASLIDYERIVDEDGRRLVSFSRFAGLAGMIDTLWITGRRWAVQGRSSPLTELKQALAYDSLAEAKAHIVEVGRRCRATPGFSLTLGLTGMGRVSRGALEIARLLEPHVVGPEALSALGTTEGFHLALFDVPDMVTRRNGGEVDGQEYRQHPERYESIFARSLPFLDVLVNGIYWEEAFPRLVTKHDLVSLYESGEARLQVIGDISCDIEGSIEATVRPCDPGHPAYVFDTRTGDAVEGVKGHGPVIMATDILPTELPREASRAFSEALVDLLRPLQGVADATKVRQWPWPPELARALIVANGQLQPDYAYLQSEVA